MLLWCFNFL